MGVPLMVNVLPTMAKLTPGGKPLMVTPVALPPKSYVMLVMAEFLQSSCASVPAADVRVSVASAVTVMVPLKLTGAQLLPVVVMV